MKTGNLKDAPYFPIVWAFHNTVERLSDERILVTGKVPMLGTEFEHERDPYSRYISSVKSKFGQNSSGKDSPHIRFANATNDDLLIDFVRTFGPVAPSEIVEVESKEPEEVALGKLVGRSTHVGAILDLPTLRQERRAYAAALGLVCELRRGRSESEVSKIRFYLFEIANGILSWPEQWSYENEWRAAHRQGRMTWRFGSSGLADVWRLFEQPYECGQDVLCELINSFPTTVVCFGEHPTESLLFDAVPFGIRPSLYLILKREFLWGSGTLICRNDRCSEFFVSERAGQIFCNEDCSRQYRQRKYWAERGSKNRKQRVAEAGRKAKKGNARRGR